ncbi:Zinc finger CCCH domain-containing protein 18 [Eumeta japonica]|uniref:Zinc finger CCCH domain-containing protein 18 n=1 Tax=Eumeta variegata TaxID=151549 RepID=A0A4C1X310_EUMVA|nr:Zinc finger CCCH domain-containing protein 18 [Eumeta japonica]
MDSEDSRDGSGDGQSSSSSSSSSSRSSSTERSDASKKGPKSISRSPTLPKSEGPRSPTPESRSQSPHSPEYLKSSKSQDNLSEVHSDIDSPEDSAPTSPLPQKSPEAPKSPSDVGSNASTPEPNFSSVHSPPEGPRTPQTTSSVRSPSPNSRSKPASPNYRTGPTSSINKPEVMTPEFRSRHSSPNLSPSRSNKNSSHSSPENRNEWSSKDNWRNRSRSRSYDRGRKLSRNRSPSDSSRSSRGSSYNKRSSAKDPVTEEISEGEMESDQEDEKEKLLLNKASSKGDGCLNISHEDLSDVSDLDSVDPEDTEKEVKKSALTSPEQSKVNGINFHSSPKSDGKLMEPHKLDKLEKTNNTEDDEEQLDFEAEEGECVEHKPKEQPNGETENNVTEKGEVIKPGKRSRGSSLEEGEVSDEGERRPEESEPRPVCRFYSRGACTWGVSCRFLHPGVTDKGNYSMFDVVRGVPVHAPPGYPAREPAPPESAWERGLRTAKEMLRIANKRKEQDMDFEEKKLHLSVGGVVHDPDAELAYAAAAVGASPPRHDLPPPPHREPDAYSRPYGPVYRPPRFVPPRVPPEEREWFYDRERYERERVYERPPHYDERLAALDETYQKQRRGRSSREVIVQRAEVSRREAREGRETRGEEWEDPWMRASPAARRRRPPSSDDSYSSTRLSPSVIVRERRLASARATAMNPPAPRRRQPSPAAARQHAANPPPPASHRNKEEVDQYGRTKPTNRSRERKKYSRSSSSGTDSSSSSSESESESRSSSSSGSSSEAARRGRQARLLNAAARPRMTTKSNAGLTAAVTVGSKKEIPPDHKEAIAKKRVATSPVNSAVPAKKSVSRREELLKQLKAVEDAIARKRSKI